MHELPEQRVWAVRAALELRVELTGDEPRVVGKLDDLDQGAVRRLTRANQPGFGQLPA